MRMVHGRRTAYRLPQVAGPFYTIAPHSLHTHGNPCLASPTCILHAIHDHRATVLVSRWATVHSCDDGVLRAGWCVAQHLAPVLHRLPVAAVTVGNAPRTPLEGWGWGGGSMLRTLRQEPCADTVRSMACVAVPRLTTAPPAAECACERAGSKQTRQSNLICWWVSGAGLGCHKAPGAPRAGPLKPCPRTQASIQFFFSTSGASECQPP